MEWLKIGKEEAREIMNSWGDNPSPNFDPSYDGIRLDVLNFYETIKNSLGLSDSVIFKSGYKFDLEFGLLFYNLINSEYGMSPRIAADDGIWRYLSIRVLPDIVYYRWGNTPSRFWQQPNRVWLKVLWWYIHLSYQGSLDKTRVVIEQNTTDHMVQLVERAGSYGYRVDFTRELMKQHHSRTQGHRKSSDQIFRKVMKLNTARCKMIEPELIRGGVEEYVKELYDYFDS